MDGTICWSRFETKVQMRRIPTGMEFECDETGRVVQANSICSIVIKKDSNRPKVDKENVTELAWRDEDYFRDRIYSTDDLSKTEAKKPREEYINRRLMEALKIDDRFEFRREEDPKIFVTFDEEGYCIIAKLSGSSLKIVDFMRDENGNKTRYDNGGKGTDRYGADKSGANKFGLPTGLSLEDVANMSQEELDEKVRESMDQFMLVDTNELLFENTPVERIISTYISFTRDGNVSKEEAFGRMAGLMFHNNAKITGREIKPEEIEAINKLMHSAIIVAKENDIDVRAFIDKDLAEKEEEDRKRIEEAQAFVSRGKGVLQKGFGPKKDHDEQVESMIKEIEENFDLEL